MIITMVRFIREDEYFSVTFLTKVGEIAFETETMISKEDIFDENEDSIVAIAWGRVRTAVQYNATKIENSVIDMSDADTTYGYLPIISKIQISGSPLVYISNNIISEQYTASFLDQYGGTIQGSQPTWSVMPTIQGISIDSTGVMTIDIQAVISTLPLEITASSNGVESAFSVLINPRIEIPKTEDQLRIELLEQKNTLLTAQNNAISERADFIEDIIAEMAMMVYT